MSNRAEAAMERVLLLPTINTPSPSAFPLPTKKLARQLFTLLTAPPSSDPSVRRHLPPSRHGARQVVPGRLPRTPPPAPVRAQSSTRGDAGEVPVVLVHRRVPAPGRRLSHRVRALLPPALIRLGWFLGYPRLCSVRVDTQIFGVYLLLWLVGWFLTNASRRSSSA